MGEKLQAIESSGVKTDRTILNGTTLAANQRGLGILLGDMVKEKSSSPPEFGK